MSGDKCVFCVGAVIVVLLGGELVEAREDYSIEISTAENQIEYGSPTVVSLRVVFQEPQMWPPTGKARLVVKLDGSILRVQDSDTKEVSLFRYMPIGLHLQGTEGLEYSGKLVVWCDVHRERRKLVKRMVFDKAGSYGLRIERGGVMSNELDIVVKPSELGEKAMSLLTDAKDLAFLEGGGEKKDPKTLSRLRAVVEQCRDTVLAKWAAARLGLTYFEEFEEKYASSAKTQALVAKGLDDEPLFGMAYAYLTAGRKLPGEFPVQAEVLGRLATAECIRGDYQKAIRLLEELGEKYSESEDGKKAAAWKEDVLAELERAAQAEQRRKEAAPPRYLSVAVGIFVVSLVVILLLKKRTRRAAKGPRES